MTLLLTPVRTVAPTGLPVTVSEARAQLGVSAAITDAMLSVMIASVVGRYEGWRGLLGGVAFVNQTWRADYVGFDGDLRLPILPVQSITSVGYFDAANVAQVVAPANYSLQADALGPYLNLTSGSSWPTTYDRRAASSVTYVAGYGTAAQWSANANPEDMGPIKQAILLMVQKFSSHAARDISLLRETVDGVGTWQWGLDIATSFDDTVDGLLSPYRRFSL